MEYTFTFEKDQVGKFNRILERIEGEYTIVEPMSDITENEKGQKLWEPEKKIVLDMDSESCLTIRMGMGNTVKIRRTRTEEELAAEKKYEEENTIRINVIVPKGSVGVAPTGE